jgi:plastocyanin
MSKFEDLYKRIIPAFIGAVILLFAASAFAMNVRAIVQDDAGKQVKDAVVYATNAERNAPAPRHPRDAVMDQQDEEFGPYVLPVQTGTTVYFPNKDNIRHHVYSLFPPKKFELMLYKGSPPAPVLFDQPGVVVLGCNIHDWMIAYIFVLETPYFAKTGEDGKAEIQNLPDGAYEIRTWHPLMKETTESTAKRMAAPPQGGAGSDVELEFRITLKPEWRPPRVPPSPGGGYR